jgi:predicted dehydrogenase|tara:strand:- start:1120 stop:2040 length:921 start_codon:yes stop_codon:yes gene_type:complete
MKKVLVIGTGSIAQKHINVLNSLNYSVYVYSETNDKFFKKNSKIYRLANLNKLNNFEFTILANKTSDHLKILKILTNQNMHIYCEKPIFYKKFNYQKIRDQIKKNKIVFHNGYQLRNDKKIRYIQQKLKNLKIKSFQVSVGHDFKQWRNAGVHKNSYFSDTKKGGGVIFELVHEINLINLLFGKIKKISTIKSNSKNFRCEDVAVSIIKTENKIVGSLYQDMFSKFFFRYIAIVTNKSFFKIDMVKNLIIENNKIKKFKNANKQVDLLRKNILLFKNRISKKDYSLNDYDTALLDLDTCIKMHNTK